MSIAEEREDKGRVKEREREKAEDLLQFFIARSKTFVKKTF